MISNVNTYALVYNGFRRHSTVSSDSMAKSETKLVKLRIFFQKCTSRLHLVKRRMYLRIVVKKSDEVEVNLISRFRE